MGARTGLVHVGSRDGSGLVAFILEVLDIAETGDDELAEIFDVRAQAGMFSDLEIALVFGVEQVAHLFVVDLDVANLYGDFEVGIGSRLVANVVKEL